MIRYLAALTMVAAAVPASATIVIYTSPGAVNPEENVLFNGVPAPSGNNAFGRTNQSNTGVTFTGIEPLSTPASGQARVTGADDQLSQILFSLTDPTLAFKEVEFNVFNSGANAGPATSANLVFTDQFGGTFSQTVSITNGQNFFSARAFDNQFIRSVSITANGDFSDLRQVRLGGVGEFNGGVVPEPATWAMMIAGFGLVGVSMRRRRSIGRVTA